MSPVRIKRRYIILVVGVGLIILFAVTQFRCYESSDDTNYDILKFERELIARNFLIELLNDIDTKDDSYNSDVIELIDRVTQWNVNHDIMRQIIFVGGVPRSGTTLMRVLLDAHKNISCGQETRIIPRILKMISQWNKSSKEVQRLDEASLDENAINRVMGVMFMQIFREQSEGTPEHFCNKDPFNLAHIHDLENIFPNAKFILMIRDGRAVTHSITTRGVTISGVDIRSEEKVLGFWNSACENMIRECSYINHKYAHPHCLEVFYEKLISDTERELKRVFTFLDITWDNRILHHEQLVDNGGIKLSKLEPSSKQVSKAIYNESLYKWRSELSPRFLVKAHESAPLLARLGYT
ncbi:Protein-tyrosine sulfotransferase 1 [Oopsacas minuta]|uniref:Protein-tyrosine sulfotransferase n=1 Tax=Oopsacas minuta TaxID=111878 RepID=A0AAV7JMX2_9METZ|nr:Protein-tyrosine sulfotransferase 1 [Oopsacas minuta]